MAQTDADARKLMDAADLKFRTSFVEAGNLQLEDRLEECIEKAEALLADDGIPRYWRVKTLLLLGSTVGDLDDAYQYWEDAETLWRIVRRWHPVGEFPGIDAALADLRVEIDDLKKILDDEALEATSTDDEDEYDSDNDNAQSEEGIAEHDGGVLGEEPRIAGEDDPEEFLKADAATLGKTVEELRKLDVGKSHVAPVPHIAAQQGQERIERHTGKDDEMDINRSTVPEPGMLAHCHSAELELPVERTSVDALLNTTWRTEEFPERLTCPSGTFSHSGSMVRHKHITRGPDYLYIRFPRLNRNDLRPVDVEEFIDLTPCTRKDDLPSIDIDSNPCPVDPIYQLAGINVFYPEQSHYVLYVLHGGSYLLLDDCGPEQTVSEHPQAAMDRGGIAYYLIYRVRKDLTELPLDDKGHPKGFVLKDGDDRVGGAGAGDGQNGDGQGEKVVLEQELALNAVRRAEILNELERFNARDEELNKQLSEL